MSRYPGIIWSTKNKYKCSLAEIQPSVTIALISIYFVQQMSLHATVSDLNWKQQQQQIKKQKNNNK